MVVQAMKASQPVVTYSPASLAARDFGDLAKKILQLDNDVPLNGNIQFFVERGRGTADRQGLLIMSDARVYEEIQNTSQPGCVTD